MVSSGLAGLRRIEELYAGLNDPAFSEVARCLEPATDADLADLIEADGRIRLRRGLEVDLHRYMLAVADLQVRIEPLDAAIDVTLRALAARGVPHKQAVRELIDQHPSIQSEIREAAALNEAVLSTASLHRVLSQQPERRSLPEEFGPRLADGRRRYQLTEFLGAGSDGEVYKATDRLLSESGHDAVVAIKIVGRSDASPWARQRFAEEATKARRIIHPQVVRVIDRGGDESTPDFIVYEYVPGGDLQRSRDGKGPLDQDEVIRLMSGVASGIQAAHSAGVVHCDLKPSNILLTDTGEPKVADFGIAVRQHASGPEAVETEAGSPIGNLAFIAPEQYRMEPGAYAPAADIYSLGGIMFWLATGELPNGASAREIQATHDPVDGRRAPPSVRALRRDFDRDLDKICARCMAPDPKERYASVAQLVDDLRAWQRREPVAWTRPSAARHLSLWIRRRPAVAGSVALVLLILTVAGTATLTLWHQADVAKSEISARDQQRAEILNQFRVALDAAMLLAEQGESWQVMPIFPYLEWVQSTSVLGDPVHEIPVWSNRISIIRILRAAAVKAGGPMDLEALLLESTLAFWLVCDDQYEEAAPLLTENRRRWTDAAPGAARWHEWLATVEACCDIARVERNAELDPASKQDNLALEQAGRRLVDARDKLAKGPTRHALLGLIDKTLVKLYGPRLLDQPKEAAKYAERRPSGGVVGRLKSLLPN